MISIMVVPLIFFASLFAANMPLAKSAQDVEPVILGYFPKWASRREGNLKYEVHNIRGDLITHLVYCYVGAALTGEVVNPYSYDYPKLKDLKTTYPKLKILIGVGGHQYSASLSDLVKYPTSMAVFAENIAKLIHDYNFDGVSIDWWEPKANQKKQYIKLLTLIRNELGTNLTLITILPATRDRTDGFDVPKMNGLLDYFGIMTFDFAGPWDSKTGHNSPLISSGESNVEKAMSLWEGLGAPVSKLLVSLPFNGHTWTLSSSNTGVGAPGSTGAQTILGEAGSISWFEIEQNAWPETWDSEASVPYAVEGDQWVSYDNPRSLNIKINFTCITKQYPGVLIWDLSLDPQASLLPGIFDNVSMKCASNGVTVAPTAPPDGGECGNLTAICVGATFGDLRSYPPDCTRFVTCIDPPVTEVCPPGLSFNPSVDVNVCDWPYNFVCPTC